MINPNTPVLVGVAQIKNRLADLEETLEPLELMLRACRKAEEDTGVDGLLAQAQSVRVIRGIWPYENPAKYIAHQLGTDSAETKVQTVGTLIGGNHNQLVVNETAASILAGELDLVLITGAENGYSAAKARKAGVKLEYTKTPGTYDLVIGAQKPEHHAYEIARGISTAIQVYPMYDNAIRFHRGETIDEHLVRISELWSRFNDVAQTNPGAWIQDNVSAGEIRTASATNRAVSVPYTKFMNANNAVDMGAALILCSVKRARELGIDERLWVYPHAGAEGQEHFSASVRDNFYSSPGIRIVGQRALELAQTEPGDLAFVDLYSCFPSAVQVAAQELGIPETSQLTVTGGLTFAGGPINNYVMHSIARMVEVLRENPGKKGLITAQGGNLYKHAHGVYSSEPPAQDFRHEDVQDEIERTPSRECLDAYTGEATVESYTVMFAGEDPGRGHFTCLTPRGQRVWILTEDRDLMRSMTSEEFCGRRATIDDAQQITIKS